MGEKALSTSRRDQLGLTFSTRRRAGTAGMKSVVSDMIRMNMLFILCPRQPDPTEPQPLGSDITDPMHSN